MILIYYRTWSWTPDRVYNNHMERAELLKRISIDSTVCFGGPCIRGTRLWISLILDRLAAGMSIEGILEEYPQLTREDILACMAYGAEMSPY